MPLENTMYCSDAEILLAEYVEGTLPDEVRASLEHHLESCPGCRELADDAAAATAFLSRTTAVEPPPELVTKILYQVPVMKPSLARRLFGRVFGGWLEPILQPRLVMGMGAAALSFFMLEPRVHQLAPANLDPVKVWTTAENRVSRMWDRGVKEYENMRLVYEIQARVNEWQADQSQQSLQRDSK